MKIASGCQVTRTGVQREVRTGNAKLLTAGVSHSNEQGPGMCSERSSGSRN